MPAVLTHERLNKNGWNVKSVEFTRTDLNVRRSPREPSRSPTPRSWTRCGRFKKEPSLLFVMENNGGEFLMIAKNEIKDCKDTDGKRFAIHGEGCHDVACSQAMAA